MGATLKYTNGNRAQAAQLLGVNAKTLYRWTKVKRSGGRVRVTA